MLICFMYFIKLFCTKFATLNTTPQTSPECSLSDGDYKHSLVDAQARVPILYRLNRPQRGTPACLLTPFIVGTSNFARK